VILHGWRIAKTKTQQGAFSGEGARLYGGRWNSRGIPVVYVSSTASLAVLEMLVHLGSEALLNTYSLWHVQFDESLVRKLDPVELREDWRSSPPPFEVQNIGDLWAKKRTSVILQVPSVIVPQESNYLINPRHPDFAQVRIGEPEQFALDSRLLRK